MKVGLIGDIALSGLISKSPEDNNYRFADIESKTVGFDIIFSNLEMPISIEDSVNQHKEFLHFVEEGVVRDILSRLNITCVSLANNHIYDYKMSGLKTTIGMLDSMKIKHTGAGWKDSHVEPVVIEKENKKIAFLAYVDKSTNPKTESYSELRINYLDEQVIVDKIKAIKKDVDKVILSLHWGKDYSNFFTEKQQRLARNFIDAGADLIMGHHPHTLQGYEIYKEKHIFYSLGQLCFGDFLWEGKLRALRLKTKKGVIVKLDNFENLTVNYTKELKGNFIKNRGVDRGERLFRHTKKTNWLLKNSLYRKYIKIKESLFDRIYEIFFGYYRNPLLIIFQKNSWNKLTYIKRDIKKD